MHTEVLSRFCLENLPVPCQWTHVTMGAREESREEAQAATGSRGNSPTAPHTSAVHSSNKRKSTGSLPITKFMKRFTSSEQVLKHIFILLNVLNTWIKVLSRCSRFLPFRKWTGQIYVICKNEEGEENMFSCGLVKAIQSNDVPALNQ